MNTQSSPRQEDAPAPPGGYLSGQELTRILVAIALDGRSAVALQRADDMARTLGADLYVLHVIPAKRWLDAIFAEHSDDEDPAVPERIRAAMEATSRFCELILGRPFSSDHIAIREGATAQRIIEAAGEIDAALVVVGGSSPGRYIRHHSRHIGSSVMREADRPVLMARAPTSTRTIVAATDFSDEAFPALTRASDLGARLHAPVTFVHNIGLTGRVARASALGLPMPAAPDVVAQRRVRLRELADGLGGSIDTVVLTRESATEAILEVARLQDADMVVIGTRRRGTLDTTPLEGTVETVATSTRRSVLAIPLGQDWNGIAA